MRFIKDIKEGDTLNGVYFCKQKYELKSKTDKLYYSITLQDKTGTLDAKVWDPNSNGIEDFEGSDFIYVQGQVTRYQSALQASLIRVKKCGEGDYDIADFIPTSKYDREEMFKELMGILDTVKGSFYKKLLDSFFKDREFAERFKVHSAAKTVHHSFLGGLLEHTLSVVRLCDFLSKNYSLLNRDLLLTVGSLHDIGKMEEISSFPANEYTDEGQLLGHIFIGSRLISEKVRKIPGFPKKIEDEIIHCILSHHGALEYGSPKLPSLFEALALSLADNMDAKLETFSEIIEGNEGRTDWLGYNKMFEANIRIATKSKI